MNFFYLRFFHYFVFLNVAIVTQFAKKKNLHWGKGGSFFFGLVSIYILKTF
jgi:hypothetical protein